MPQQQEPLLYLSKDRLHLTDAKGNIISVREEIDGKVHYSTANIESEAYEKVCTDIRALKVCVSWNKAWKCIVWDEVDVCSKWELIPKGFGNIS